MTSDFEIAGGTVAGRDHVNLGRNNQDAFCWSSTPEATVAVVADGCGSGRLTEVGAQIGARLVAEALRRRAAYLDDETAEDLLERVRLDVLAQLQVLGNAMGGGFRQVVSDYFLFTVLGFVVAPRRTVLFGIGDGVVGVNGSIQRLVAEDNTPAYLAYALVPSGAGAPAPPPFVVHASLSTVDVRSLLVGTDGVEEVTAVSEFWEADRYFTNPFNVGRRLAQLNRKPGVLPDDSTLVVLRRRA